MRRPVILSAILSVLSLCSQAQTIQRVEPPSWFTGMKEPMVQLMVYGKEISQYNVSTNYPGVSVSTVTRTENPNYLFVNVSISSDCKPGSPVLLCYI